MVVMKIEQTYQTRNVFQDKVVGMRLDPTYLTHNQDKMDGMRLDVTYLTQIGFPGSKWLS